MPRNYKSVSRRGVPRSSVPNVPIISNLNGLMSDIYVRHIALNDEDFEHYYTVMQDIFLQLHRKMEQVSEYYRKYSRRKQFVGSHSDKLRIKKPDEFDIGIEIGLPLCSKVHPLNPEQSDFILEPKEPGFIRLKTGTQFDRLPCRDGDEWEINRAAYKWKDNKKYLRQSKFSDWFKGVVTKALNEFPTRDAVDPKTRIFYVDGVEYHVLFKSESGPAVTLLVENPDREFKLDVDLVPGIRFPLGRWPVSTGYRVAPWPQRSGRDSWMVVPKPNKAGHTQQDKERAWRVSQHDQEAMLMHDSMHMKQAIRYVKKLRDAQNMTKISSYAIKTLFFWEAKKQEKEFWNRNPVEIFKHMVKKFHEALVMGKILYFWNKDNNLIEDVARNILDGYANIVEKLLQVLGKPAQYKKVAKYLLSRDEYNKEYKKFL